MTDPFLAEIRIMPTNFAPKGWAMCAGQLLPISQNTALFSLIGTTYGGDGKSTFALPNLQGNFPMHAGQGNGLSQRFLGEQSGSQNVTLLESEMPTHGHSMFGTAMAGASTSPNNQQLGEAKKQRFAQNAYGPAPLNNPGLFTYTGQGGSSLPHNNMSPYLTLNFCIALQGIFPSRS
jgi:microcystin-dependent protein